MMRLPKHKSVLFSVCFSATLLLSACVTQQEKEPPKSVEELVADNAYEAAIAHYETLPEEQQSQIDIGKIQTAKLKYEQRLLLNIRRKTKANAFPEAQTLLQEAYTNIPSNTDLQGVADNLANKKNQYIYQYKLKHNKALAQYLIKEKPILEKLHKAKADDPAFMRLYDDHQKQRKTLSETLGVQGLAAFEKKQYKTAKPLLQLADKLQPDPRWKNGLTVISKQEKSQKKKSKLAAQKKRQEQLSKLKDQFNNAMKQGEFKQAKDLLAKLKTLKNVDPQWLSQAQTRLSAQIQSMLDNALKRGQALYSQGKIDMALGIWEKAQVYVKDNKALNDSIERAKKFQQRYQQLKK